MSVRSAIVAVALLAWLAAGCERSSKPAAQRDAAAKPSPGNRVAVAACGSEPCALIEARSFAVHGSTIFVLHAGLGLLELPIEGREAEIRATVMGKSLVVDDQAVYVASSSRLSDPSARLTRVERGSASVRVIADRLETPWQLTADGGHVYWKSGGLGRERVLRVAKQGGPVETVVERAGLTSFVVRDGAILFTENATLWRQQPGKAPEAIADVRAETIAVLGQDILLGRSSWTSEILRLRTGEHEARRVATIDCMLSELVAGDAEVLAACKSTGRIVAIAATADRPRPLLKNADGAESPAAAGPWLLWLRSGRLFRMRR